MQLIHASGMAQEADCMNTQQRGPHHGLASDCVWNFSQPELDAEKLKKEKKTPKKIFYIFEKCQRYSLTGAFV